MKNVRRKNVNSNLHLIYLYSNLSFTEKQKENETKLYDALVSNGFLDLFLSNICETEYNELIKYMNDLTEIISKYRNSITSIIRGFIDDLPGNAEAALGFMNNFDPEKFQFVMDFAKAANGGRDILNTNRNNVIEMTPKQ